MTNESEPTQQAKSFKVTFSDISHLPVLHVNAMNLRFSADEFFFILGTAVPPEFESAEEMEKVNQVTAQPLFRFAISRENMEQFIALMQKQHEEQGKLRRMHWSHEGDTK